MICQNLDSKQAVAPSSGHVLDRTQQVPGSKAPHLLSQSAQPLLKLRRRALGEIR